MYSKHFTEFLWFPVYRHLNGRPYTRNQLTNGALPGHYHTGGNIFINSPVNNTQYVCVFRDDENNEAMSDPVYIIIAGEYNKCRIFVSL